MKPHNSLWNLYKYNGGVTTLMASTVLSAILLIVYAAPSRYYNRGWLALPLAFLAVVNIRAFIIVMPKKLRHKEGVIKAPPLEALQQWGGWHPFILQGEEVFSVHKSHFQANRAYFETLRPGTPVSFMYTPGLSVAVEFFDKRNTDRKAKSAGKGS